MARGNTLEGAAHTSQRVRQQRPADVLMVVLYLASAVKAMSMAHQSAHPNTASQTPTTLGLPGACMVVHEMKTLRMIGRADEAGLLLFRRCFFKKTCDPHPFAVPCCQCGPAAWQRPLLYSFRFKTSRSASSHLITMTDSNCFSQDSWLTDCINCGEEHELARVPF